MSARQRKRSRKALEATDTPEEAPAPAGPNDDADAKGDDGGDDAGDGDYAGEDEDVELSFDPDTLDDMSLADIKRHVKKRREITHVARGQDAKAAWRTALVQSPDVMTHIRRRKIAAGNATLEEWLAQPAPAPAKRKSVSFAPDVPEAADDNDDDNDDDDAAAPAGEGGKGDAAGTFAVGQ